MNKTWTYREAVTWLETRNPMPLLRPGIEKTRAALREAGLLERVEPQKVIHVAGTNGKGTTAKTLEQLLLSAGQSVGLYTSPHLVETTERLRINGQDLSQDEFAQLTNRYHDLIEKHDLSHFEALTLFAADLFFKSHQPTWAIFEIGLGGTWDATNVIPHHTSVITPLGMDHMHILGNTLEEIASNKFGIIQKGNLVFRAGFDESIEPLFSQVMGHQGAHDHRVEPARFEIEKGSPLPRYILKTPWGDTALSLPGSRAANNMLLALNVFAGLGFDPKQHLATLSKILWPARMTPLKGLAPCPVYLSGDHNVQGIKSVIEILKDCDYENLYVILGVSKNRILKDFITPLEELRQCEVILTKPQFQGVEPETSTHPFFASPLAALEWTKSKAQPRDLIVITGSLYLCGDFLKQL